VPHRNTKPQWMTRVILLTISGFLLVSFTLLSSDSIKLVSMPDFGDVIDFELTSDGKFVVFTADMDIDDIPDLYSVPAGGGTPTKLNNLTSENGVSGFMLSPDGARAVYVIDYDLYSVPVDGSKTASVKLHDGGINIGYVTISPDSSRVVYPVIESAFIARELYSVPIQGGDTVRLNEEMVDDSSVDYFYIVISPDSRYVVYRADQDSRTVDELYSVPIDGPASAGVKLNRPLPLGGDVDFKNYAISPDSSGVVYIADQDVDQVDEIYSVPITGPATSGIKLNDTLPLGGDVENFKINPDNSSVIYRADQDQNDIMELYNAPIKGGDPVKLNHDMEEDWGSVGDDVHAFELSPDGRRIVFEASWGNRIQDYPEDYNIFSFNVYELFSVPVNGPASEEVKLWEPSEKVGYGNGDRYVDEKPPFEDALSAANHPICDISINHQGSTVVYRSEYPIAGYCVLWRVPIDGSMPAEKLFAAGDSTLPEIEAYQVTKDDSKVIYSMAYDSDQADGADQSNNSTSKQAETRLTELFSVPIGGPAESSEKLNGSLVLGGSVSGWDLSINNPEVVYRADQDTLDIQELYLADLPGHTLYLPLLLQE